MNEAVSMELERNDSATIGTSSTIISEEKSAPNQRAVIFITNTSTGGQTISIAVGDEAEAGKGIPIEAGGYYQESIDAGFKPSNKRIAAISSAANGTISIYERVVFNGV